jgi:hypothetical protein
MAIADFEGTIPPLPEEFFNGRLEGWGKLGACKSGAQSPPKAIGNA